MTSGALDDLIRQLARLPGLGPRSARRAALALLKQRETLMVRLAQALAQAAAEVRACARCGNLDAGEVCAICRDPLRQAGQLCVVEAVDDLWAIERSGLFKGCYHVLGGTLSAIDGLGPEDLGIERLLARVAEDGIAEVILATSATVEGQTTAHYLAERLEQVERDTRRPALRVTQLAQGLPMGGELNYLDDGTLGAALRARRPMTGRAGDGA